VQITFEGENNIAALSHQTSINVNSRQDEIVGTSRPPRLSAVLLKPLAVISFLGSIRGMMIPDSRRRQCAFYGGTEDRIGANPLVHPWGTKAYYQRFSLTVIDLNSELRPHDIYKINIKHKSVLEI